MFEHLRAGVARVLTGEPREPLFSVVAPPAEPAETGPNKVLEMPMPANPTSTAGEVPAPADHALASAAEGDAKR